MRNNIALLIFFFLTILFVSCEKNEAPSMEDPEEFMTANIETGGYEADNFSTSAISSTPRPSSFTFSSHTFDPAGIEEQISIGFSMYQNRSQNGEYITDTQFDFPEISNCTSSDLGILCGQMTVRYGDSSPNSTRAEYSSQLTSGNPEIPFQINFTELDIRYEGVISGSFSGVLSNREDESDKIMVTNGRFRIILD